MEPKIIYEDEELIVLNKPSGWITNEAETTKNQPVLQKWLYDNFSYPIAKNNRLRSGIVHRLDKETSGVLIVAKTVNTFAFLQSQFKQRLVSKEYSALAHGMVDPTDGSVEVPVGRLPWARKKFGIIAGGRDSKTTYSVNSYYKNEFGIYSLLTLNPKTGRTHQIRIHLKYLGHAVVSDSTYAGRKTARNDRKWCPRLFLHAKSIFLTHPVTGKNIIIESELPTDLKNSLASLEKIMLKP
jgi:23S rRNA pseudouridine1911/1915/1917 synthase